MEHSSALNELFTALAKAQAEIGVAGLTNNNPFFKSRYADLAEYVRVSRHALTKYGLSVVQLIDTAADGRLVLKTILGHSSGQHIHSSVLISPAKNDIQSIGSYITYLKRYCYASIVGVVSGNEDDDGEYAMQSSRNSYNYSSSKTIDTISKDQLEQLEYELESHVDIAERVLSGLNIERLADMPKAKFLPSLQRIQELKRLQP